MHTHNAHAYSHKHTYTMHTQNASHVRTQCTLTPHKDATMGTEPFYDLEQHALLGVANVFLECLHHSVPHDYPAPIIAPTGMVRGAMEGGEQY